MAATVQANSLTSILRLADNPPTFFRRVSEQDRRVLKLYIARVPGSQDLILTTFKPQHASVTAEDITSCLYYLRVETRQSDTRLGHEEETAPPHPPPKDPFLPPRPYDSAGNAASSSKLSVASTNRERWSVSGASGTTFASSSSMRPSRSCSPPKHPLPPAQEFCVTVIRRDVGAGTQEIVGQIMTPSECERRSKGKVTDARKLRRDRQQLMLEIWNKGYDKFLPHTIGANVKIPSSQPSQPTHSSQQVQNGGQFGGQRGGAQTYGPSPPQASKVPHFTPHPQTSQLPPSLRVGPSTHSSSQFSSLPSPPSPPSPPPPPPPHRELPSTGAVQMPNVSTYIPTRKPLDVNSRVVFPGFANDEADDSALQSPPALPPPPLPSPPNPHVMRMGANQQQRAAGVGAAENLYVSKFTEIYSPDTPVDANQPWEMQDPEVFRRVLMLEGEGFWKVTGSRLAALKNHKRSKSSTDPSDHHLEEETRRAIAEMGIQTRPPITSSHSEQPQSQHQGEVVKQKGYVFDPPNKGSGRCEFESHSGGRKLKLKFRPAYHAMDPYAKKTESLLLSTLSFQSPELPPSSSGASTPGSNYGSNYPTRSRSPSPSRGRGHHNFKAKLGEKFKPKAKRQGSWTEHEETAAGMGLKTKLGSLTIENEGLDILDLVVVSSLGVFIRKTKNWQDIRSNVWNMK